MLPIEGRPILTAAQMRAAEERAAPTPDALYALMERAGAGVAEAVRRLAAGAEVLILCGPGNNGGDGYVAARVLREWGHPVRVAALGEAVTDLARRARCRWPGPVEVLGEASSSPVLVDALFGTGLSRPLAGDVLASLKRLVDRAHLSIAVDQPSGASTDDGVCSSDSPVFDVTLALGAVKAVHVLYPAASRCGNVRLLPLGLDVGSDVTVLALPTLAAPAWNAHKFTRGLVGVVAGKMTGAGALAATAAARAGAGYVLVLGSATDRLPHAIVRRRWSIEALGDKRIGAIVVGPGLGRDGSAWERLNAVMSVDKPVVVDGDALWLMAEMGCPWKRSAPVIATPHAGEFDHLYGDRGGKIDATVAAAQRTGHVIIHKGPDTVIATPDGVVRVHSGGSSWLSTAGTGDILAGTIGAMLASGLDQLTAASAAVWLHAEAARRCGPSFIADDLAQALTAARASLCR